MLGLDQSLIWFFSLSIASIMFRENDATLFMELSLYYIIN